MTVKSGYQKRIEAKLAELSIALDPQTIVNLRIRSKSGRTLDETMLGNQEWDVVNVRRGDTDCELCGHKHIRNIFTIKCKANGNKLDIGSKCAKNYADADLIDGLCKMYNLEYNKIVNPIKFEKELENLAWGASPESTPYRRLPSVRRLMGRMVNCGSASKVIAKINGGKYIGKREKEVIALYSYLKNNQALVLVVDNAYRIGEKIRYEARMAEYEARRKQWEAEAEARRAAERRQRLYRNVLTLFANLDSLTRRRNEALAYRVCNAFYDSNYGEILREVQLTSTLAKCKNSREVEFVKQNHNSRLTVAQQKWLDDIKSREVVETEETPEVDYRGLFQELYSYELKPRDKKFVGSCYGYFKRNGFVTDGQLPILEKIKGNYS